MGDRFLYVHHTLTLMVSFMIDQNILFQEYALTGIFLFGYTINMKTLWTALTEPNRLHIVELLRDGPLTVGEITERLGLQQPQVSKHLKVLSEADIVEVQPQANRRIYTVEARAVPGVGDLATIVSSPLGRTLRSSGRLPPEIAGQ